MADENIVTNIVANADFSNLIADVHKVTASLSKLQEQIANSNKMLANQISVMNKSFSDTLRSTGQFSTHFVSLQSDVEKFGKNLDGGKLKLNQYFQTLQTHTRTSGGLIRDLAKQQVALQNAILQPLGKNAQGLMQFNVHVPRGLDEIKNKSAIARQELQIMNKVIQEGAGQLINWGKNTQWAGRQLTVGLTVPLAAFGKAAADAFRQADAELVRLTKVYGDVAGISSQQLGKVRDDVIATSKELSKAYGVSFKDTIALAADIAATGKQGNELLASVKETSRLAVLGEVDRQDAMKATLAIQTAFKQNTEQLSESINFLNAVENQTSTTLNDLVEAIPKAGPVIQGLGGSVKDLALYLTAMKEGGINASEGANALKSALASLINPTDVAVAKFKGFGIDLLGIVQENAGNVTGTLMELQGALDNLDPLQKQQAIEQLFGKFQFARLNALFENLGKQGSQTLQVLDLMKASSQDLANVAGRELSAVTESASGKYRRAVEGLKADLAGVGEQFLSINTSLINIVDNVLKFVNNLPKPLKQALSFIGGLTAVAGPLIMLTGVLANFFGYILKGIGHMKAFFRGGEGWKYLTPEILASEKAGKLIEQTFYSDAKAAGVLQLALRNLIDEFTILEAKAKTGSISVAPAINTMAGNLVQAAGTGARVVNPQHPLISPEDTRSMSHLNPVAGMTEQQRLSQTLFGVVPGAPKVNNKIKDNPQMYMSGDLPKIEGVTSIRGASTGIVAEEAAKWHAMTGALAMQSSAEIEALKREVFATGTITSSLSDSYQALLPQMTALTSKAAAASAQIVAELQAGKLTVDQARAQITQLNYEIEAAMGAAATGVAQASGRTINLTQLPLVDQPVVDPSGKSNMKELTRPGRTRSLLNRIARGLNVKTFGAGYSTETTMPKRFATGGQVYLAEGDRVPGGPKGTDTVPAWLTPGEFVVNAEATKQNLPLLQAINGNGSNGPMYNMGSNGPVDGGWEAKTSGLSGEEVSKIIPGFKGDPSRVYTLKGTSGLYIGDVTDPAMLEEFGTEAQKKAGVISRVSINNRMKSSFVPGKLLAASIKASGSANRGSTEQFLNGLAKNGIITAAEAKQTSDLIYNRYLEKISMAGVRVNDSNNNYWTLANAGIRRTLGSNSEVAHLWGQYSQNIGAHTGDTTAKAGKSGASTSALSQNLTTTDGRKISIGKLSGSNGSLFAHAAHSEPLLQRFAKAGLGAFKLGSRLPRGSYTPGAYKGFNPIRRSKGGSVYMDGGGMVPQYLAEGDVAQPARIRFGSALAAEREKGFVGKGMVGGPMAGMGVGMGMQMAGGMIGGQAGMIMQMASVLPMLAPNLLSGIPGMLGKISGGLKGVGGMAGLAGKAIGMAFRIGPLLAATAAIAATVAIFKKFKQEQEQNRIEETNSMGITKKSAEEAGIKYNNLSDSIKAVNDQLDLARAKGRNAYESLNSSGVQGLTLSIQELKANIKDAKANQKELVATFSNIDEGTDIQRQQKVVEIATNLKAQFIAAGMSAQDATNEIYSIIAASDKADMAFNAISSKGFRQIIDAATAADSMIIKLGKNMGTLSAEDLGNSISNATAALDVNLAKLMKTKDENGKLLTQQEAMAKLLDDINAKEGSQTTITQGQIEALKKTHPELAAILNTSDNVAGMYSKWRLLLSGVRTDLSKISSEQAQALAAFEAALDTSITASEKTSSGSGVAYKSQQSILALQKQIAAGGQKASIAAQKTQEQIKAEIKLIDKRIDKINEEADARKKALEANQSKENLALEIQKAQLEYADKMAAGDMAGAAQAQLKIKQLVGERETQKAIDAIEENRAKREKELIAQREKLQAQSDKAASNLASAQNNAAAATTRMGKVDTYQNEYERLVKEQSRIDLILQKDPTNKKALQDQTDLVRGPLGDLAKQISADAKGSDKALATELRKIFTGTLIDASGNSLAGKVMPSTHPKGVATYKAGSADAALKKDAATSLEGANKIIGSGGKTLSDLYNAYMGIGAQGSTTKATAFEVATNSKYGGNTNKGGLETWAKQQIISEYKLQAGQYFKYNGETYKVGPKMSAIRQATGGAIYGPGTGTSDSIPAYLSNGEYVVNAKSAASFGYGNLDKINKMAAGGLATKFDVPAYSTGGRMKYETGGAAFGSSNVTINATLNFAEAPKNGRELWKEFKNMARAEGAKVGESIVLGGSY